MDKLKALKPYFHDFYAGRDFLDTKADKSLWIILKLLDAVFRGIAQVCFANNPISGLLILIGLGFGGIEIAIGGFIGPLIAAITALILDQPRANIENGLYQYNACLVGTVIPSLYPLLHKGDLGVFTWVMVVVMSVMTVPVQSGLANILSSLTATFRITSESTSLETGNEENRRKTALESRSLLVLTFPFNVVCAIGMFMLISYRNAGTEVQSGASTPKPEEDIQWIKVFEGILVSAGQVYAALTPIGSVLIYIGLAIYSLRLAVVSLVGAAIGSFTPLLFHSFPYSNIYIGLWGYSPLLTAGALGFCFYQQNSWRTLIFWLLGSIMTVGVQCCLMSSTAKIGLPIFTLPFVFTTWFFMILNSENHHLRRR